MCRRRIWSQIHVEMKWGPAGLRRRTAPLALLKRGVRNRLRPHTPRAREGRKNSWNGSPLWIFYHYNANGAILLLNPAGPHFISTWIWLQILLLHIVLKSLIYSTTPNSSGTWNTLLVKRETQQRRSETFGSRFFSLDCVVLSHILTKDCKKTVMVYTIYICERGFKTFGHLF